MSVDTAPALPKKRDHALKREIGLIGLTWLTIYVFAIARLGDFLRRPGPRRALDVVTGTVLVGFGIRLAAEHR